VGVFDGELAKLLALAEGEEDERPGTDIPGRRLSVVAGIGPHREALPGGRDYREPLFQPVQKFLEASRKRLAGDIAHQTSAVEVKICAVICVTSWRRLSSRCWKTGCCKKHGWGWRRRRMTYRASEKQEIIRPVERSYLPVRRTLAKLGISTTTFSTDTIAIAPSAMRVPTPAPAVPVAYGTASRTKSATRS
jgi:hypothetical protein